jgi:hypothetical protein
MLSKLTIYFIENFEKSYKGEELRARTEARLIEFEVMPPAMLKICETEKKWFETEKVNFSSIFCPSLLMYR